MKTNRHINKVAVIGSGIMGSRIACHFANIGVEVLLLDIVPFDLKKEQKQDKTIRNSIVDNALKSTLKSKPSPIYSKEFISRIKIGSPNKIILFVRSLSEYFNRNIKVFILLGSFYIISIIILLIIFL